MIDNEFQTSLDTFDTSGFLIIEDAVTQSTCDQLGSDPAISSVDRAGSRGLLAHPVCKELATRLKDHAVLGPLVGRDAVAVQCTLFDKSPRKNWLVSLHQDLSIPVRQRIESAHCAGWSKKDGQWFVQPPIDVLEQLVAIRIHLDASTSENGPLRIVPGSHRRGRIGNSNADSRRRLASEVPVLAARGAAIAMRPLLLHASSKAATDAPSRRVLHYVFGPRELPYGLEWGSA
jgi:phytanoyl-CoA dioxygenase PhyH